MSRRGKPSVIPIGPLVDVLYEPADRRDQCNYWLAILAQSGEHGLLIDSGHVARLSDLLRAAHETFDINAPEPR